MERNSGAGCLGAKCSTLWRILVPFMRACNCLSASSSRLSLPSRKPGGSHICTPNSSVRSVRERLTSSIDALVGRPPAGS